MTHSPRASIIIPNYNGLNYMPQCLECVFTQTYPNYEVIVVDDGSYDKSPDFVEAHYPSVRLIRRSQNQGFARAVNHGIRASEGRYVVVLNNDTQVSTDWLSHLVEATESGPAVGMCASKILYLEDKNVLDSAGLTVDRAGIAWSLRNGEFDVEDFSSPCQEVFGASAGAALYRREMLDQIGLFDEDFGMYLEDADLAWRAQLAGWRALYTPLAVVFHAHSATAKNDSPFKAYHLTRNRIWMIAKNYPSHVLRWWLPVIAASALVSLTYRILTGRGQASIRGYRSAIRGLGKALEKRRVIQSLATPTHVSRVWQLMPNPPGMSTAVRQVMTVRKLAIQSDVQHD